MASKLLQAQPKPVSRLVVNGYYSPKQVEDILAGSRNKPNTKGRRPVAAIMLTEYGGKQVLVALCGAKLLEGEFFFTVMGAATLEVLSGFAGFRESVILRFVDCTTGDMERKVLQTLDAAPTGSAIAFIGDIAGACSGQIVKHMGLTGESLELERIPDGLDGAQ